MSLLRKNLKNFNNVSFHLNSVGDLPFTNQSLDFAYCLGVLHHVPNTKSAIMSISKILKSGAPFLLYLYYDFDNRPYWFILLYKISNLIRKIICIFPQKLKNIVCDIIAGVV